MKLQLTDKQLELLTQTFNDYAENGVGNRIGVVNTYWNVVEGISVMMEVESMADASLVLDDRYGLGVNSLTKNIKEKEFSQLPKDVQEYMSGRECNVINRKRN